MLAPSLALSTTLFRKEGGGPYEHLMELLPRRIRAAGMLASLGARCQPRRCAR